jgi:GT2 family glycosyltransferase
MDLSICVVSFNTCEILERTLRAARRDAAGLKSELIVVDNGSVDGSVAMVRREFPEARLVANPENRFFSAANNQAIDATTGRYVLILNSDAEILPGTLGELVGYMESHPGTGAVTSRMLFPEGRLQRNCARFLTFPDLLLENTFLGMLLPRRRERLRKWRWYGEWDRESERLVDVAPGSFLLVRREAIAAAGALDESLRLYFSDDDWCWRMTSRGFPVKYLPVGGVVHPEGASVRQIRGRARRIYFEDMSTYTAKHFGRRRAAWLSALAVPTRLGLTLADAVRGE